MKLRLLSFLGLCVCCGPLLAGTCSVSDAQRLPKPGWTSMVPVEGDEKYYGIGIADISGSDISRAMGEARSKANAELAQSIRVTVSSTIKSSESKLSENGKTAIRSNFEAVTDSVANLTLQSVALDGQWIDASECRLWVRVSLTRQEAQRVQKVEVAKGMAAAFEAQMEIADQTTRSVPERERAVAASAEILTAIDPAQIPTFSVDAARIRLDASRAGVADARVLFSKYGEQLGAHLKAFVQMSGASAAGPKRVAATSAMKALQSMQGMAPGGMPGLALPFDLDQRMGALFTELDTPCMARKWFAERGKPVPTALSGKSQSCAPADVGHELRQLYLAGRTVKLSCTIVLDGQSRTWDKACASMQEKLTRDGVVIVTGTPQNKDPVIALKVSATGAMKKRVDAESQTTFYRFEGVINTAFNGPDQVDIVDQYEGITGWNPVSAAMTTDVLALNVTSRLDAAINKHWEK